MASAKTLLEIYRTRARLIITTLLHCALPAIAMGIPVIVFYPLNDGQAHKSDIERFSALSDLVPIYQFESLDTVNWNPTPVDISAKKFALLEDFFIAATKRWGSLSARPIGPIAPSSMLPLE